MVKILIDTREQLPYTFKNIDPRPETAKKTLETGDYSIAGLTDHVTIERKTLSDLFGSVGQGRKRFEREFQRMAKMDYAALMIEATWQDVFLKRPEYTRMNSKSVYRTVSAWSVKYGVHVWWGSNRKLSEKMTYTLLNWFFNYHGGKK